MSLLSSKALAQQFVQCFSGANLRGLEALLSDGFKFDGPLLNCSSKSEYLDALEGDLDPEAELSIDAVIEQGERAAAFYRYKGVRVAQLFVCREGKIVETTVVFDSAKVA